MNRHKISELIETTLSYTNGWRISSEDYKKHCDDIAQQIIEYAESKAENQPILDVSDSLCFNEGYRKGWADATSEAIEEINKNYNPKG